MYHSMIVSTFTELYNWDHHPVLDYFHGPSKLPRACFKFPVLVPDNE